MYLCQLCAVSVSCSDSSRMSLPVHIWVSLRAISVSCSDSGMHLQSYWRYKKEHLLTIKSRYDAHNMKLSYAPTVQLMHVLQYNQWTPTVQMMHILQYNQWTYTQRILKSVVRDCCKNIYRIFENIYRTESSADSHEWLNSQPRTSHGTNMGTPPPLLTNSLHLVHVLNRDTERCVNRALRRLHLVEDLHESGSSVPAVQLTHEVLTEKRLIDTPRQCRYHVGRGKNNRTKQRNSRNDVMTQRKSVPRHVEIRQYFVRAWCRRVSDHAPWHLLGLLGDVVAVETGHRHEDHALRLEEASEEARDLQQIPVSARIGTLDTARCETWAHWIRHDVKVSKDKNITLDTARCET